ncbi:YadA-like family protein, partial [Salmonella enterica]|nr:YadA-like family protein [Salmonella enterica]
RQLDAVAGDVENVGQNALLFDGTTYNATRGGAATRISGVADGVDAGDAVNRGQLDTVSGQLQDLDGLAVKYTDASHTAVVFGNPEGQAVRLSNVADGVEGTDAVNKRQLDAVVSDVGQVSDNALLFDGQAYNATRGGQSTRITGVAAAITGGDAVNFDQVSALTAVFGGGVNWSNGVLSNPTYNIGGGNFSNVGDALAAVDGKLASLENRVGGVEASPAMQRPVIYDDSTKDAVTLEGVNGTRISNVQAGVAGTDAANVDQVRQGIAESRTYTDTKTQETLRESKAYTDSRVDDMWRGVEDIAAQVDRRFHETDKRINRQSAMTAAMVQMATNAAGSRSERGRIGAGLGWSSGERALSIGYSRAIGERGSFSIGGALSGGESSAGVGFGFDL